MGNSNTKHSSQNKARQVIKSGAAPPTDEKYFWLAMEGPSFHCAYLNFIAVSKPPTNINAIQSPIKELYLQYRKTPASGRSANLKLIQKGVLVTLFENGLVKAELFFDFSSVTFVEAVRYLPIKRDRKHKAIFIPLDESKGAVSDKHVFSLDKNFQFLSTASHPPLVVCVVRRPTGVKALDCHVFALDTIENALHIAALIASTQMPAGQMTRMDSAGDISRISFDRGVRGDVVRTDLGEFSVYKGAQSYDAPLPRRYSGGPVPEVQPGSRYIGGPVQDPGRNVGYPGVQGPIFLTQDNFREPPLQQPYGGPPPPKAYGLPEQGRYRDPPGPGYPRPPDVIMNTRQPSVDSVDRLPQDRGVGGSEPGSGGLRQRYDEVNMRNSNNRVPGMVLTDNRTPGVPLAGPTYRHSADLLPPIGRTGLPSGNPAQLGAFQRHSEHIPSVVSPPGIVLSTRSPAVTSPKPREVDIRDEVGPVFSASNLESRGQVLSSEPEERHVGGRPVAKVPPHMKGIKVLPSDFRMVKLKPKVDRRSDSLDDGYDNDKDVLEKYRELQEYEQDADYAGGVKQANARTNLQESDFRAFSDASKTRSDERSRDFLSQWNETVRETSGGHGNESTTDSFRYGDAIDYKHHPDDHQHNRHGGPSYSREAPEVWGQRTPPAANAQVAVKELEIANMFSNMKVHPSNSGHVYRPTGDRNQIEQGLGYLP